MLKTIITCYLLLSISFGIAQEKDTSISIINYQKEVIAKLTGKNTISKNRFLRQRASYEERFLSAEYLASELKRSGWSFELQKYRTPQSNYFLDLFFNPNKGINVVGKLLASKPTKKYLILGAHYDSERNSPGAVDNASGVALCLALAKELQQFKHRQYNIIIAFFDQEEDDEVGSNVFVEKIQNENFEVHSVHIFDLIGYDSDNDFALTLQSPAPLLEDVYLRKAKEENISIQIIGGAASDNKPFLEAKYATIHPFEELDDRTPYYHSPQDSYETVNFEFLANTTQYIGNVLSEIIENNE
ncbi:M28 family peptidase [uncultured Croceitalea sp.]|uniref:M28 family metallopeptidase n=1 Tax=uncultured Croceitalea sp. TaxID=1798908 RepID=UPI003305E01A